MVPGTNTVVDPLAVVIESVDALVADVAVAWVSCADNLTSWAENIWLKLFDQLKEWDLLGSTHEPRLLLYSDDKEYKLENEHGCQDYEPNIRVDVC